MGIVAKTSTKTAFQDGARPPQSDYDNWIDSAVFINLTADAGTAVPVIGLYEITSTASSTSRARSEIGLQILSLGTPSSGRSIVGLQAITSVGSDIQDSTSAQAVLNVLGSPAYGRSIILATATSTALNLLGAGSAGSQLVGVSATAQISAFVQDIGPVLFSTITTGTTLGTTQSFSSDFRQLTIGLPSAATQISNVEILVAATPVSSSFTIRVPNLAVQMRRTGLSDYDAGATDYRFAAKFINRSEGDPTLRTTAGQASAAYIAFVGNTIGFDSDPRSGAVWGVLNVQNFNNTARQTTLRFDGMGHRSGGGVPTAYRSYTIHNTAATIDEIRLFFTQQMTARYMEARIYAQI